MIFFRRHHAYLICLILIECLQYAKHSRGCKCKLGSNPCFQASCDPVRRWDICKWPKWKLIHHTYQESGLSFLSLPDAELCLSLRLITHLSSDLGLIFNLQSWLHSRSKSVSSLGIVTFFSWLALISIFFGGFQLRKYLPS